MAEEHNALKYGVLLSQAAAKAAGGAYGDVGISRLSESLTPVLDLWSRPEWSFLRQEILWGVVPAQPAVAGEFSSVGVSSRTGSDLIVTVEGFYLLSAVNTRVDIMVGANVAFTATGNPSSRDTRKLMQGGVTGVETISFAHHQVASLGTRIGTLRLGTNGEQGFWPFAAVVAPGTFLAVQAPAANIAVEATIIGRERHAFPGELGRG